jgi:hypothetical protein
VCVCVCVYEREKEREKKKVAYIFDYCLGLHKFGLHQFTYLF